jgi:hypothetical protein
MKAKTLNITRLDKRMARYLQDKPFFVSQSRSWSPIFLSSIHSFPKRYGEYQSELRLKQIKVVMMRDQILILFIVFWPFNRWRFVLS